MTIGELRGSWEVWPQDAEELIRVQQELAARSLAPWVPPEHDMGIAACWVCFRRGVTGAGAAGEPAWAAVVLSRGGRIVERHTLAGTAGGPYLPGLLALRIGPLCEQVVRSLGGTPDVVLVDATGRDHPRRAGLAVQLGAVLDVPTVGVTHRPLTAEGGWPADEPGASSPLTVGGETVAYWLRTRTGTRPLVVHPGWRTEPRTALDVVRRALAAHRTPEPLRAARQLARRARGSPGDQ